MVWSAYLAEIRALICDPAAPHPGGMEPGESPEEAARREVFEETALRLPGVLLIGGFGGETFVVDYGGGPSTAYAVFLYGCVVARSELVLQADEVVEYGWFSATEIAGLTMPPDMQVMVPAALAWFETSDRLSRPATD